MFTLSCGLVFEEMMMIDFDEWLAVGEANKWVSGAVCSTHDSIPVTPEEDAEFEEGDPCIHVLRLFESAEDYDAAHE